MSINFICQNYCHSIKNKPEDYKQPLKSLMLNNNPKLQSEDWQKLFDEIIFCDYSQIKSLEAQNSGFDSKAMQIFTQNIKNQKERQKKDDLTDKKSKQCLVKLNIEQNDQINDISWKQFSEVYLQDELQSNKIEEINEQQLNKKQEKIFVKEQFKIIEKKYKERFQLNPEKLEFNLKILDLKGTNSLSSDEWSTLFDQLIITNRSKIETLNLSSTIIQQDGWQQIFNLTQNSQNKMDYLKLKLNKIMFNDNSYLNVNQWENIFSHFFLNTNLVLLQDLSLDNCSIDQVVLSKFNDAIQNQLELKILSMRRNNISNLNLLSNDKLSKLQTFHMETEQYMIDQSSIPANIKQSLKALSIRLNEQDILNQVKQLKQDIPDLVDLQLTGQYQYMQIEFEELIKFASDNFENFEIQNQNLKIDKLFNIILHVNSFGQKLNAIQFKNVQIDSQLLEIDEKEEQYNSNQEREEKKQNSKEKEEKKTSEKQINENQLFEQIKQEQNIFMKNLDASVMNLITLNLSNTKGSITNSSNSNDNYIFNQTIEYIFSYCKLLKNLYLSNCFFQDSYFQKFIDLYSVHDIQLEVLDLSNNSLFSDQSWKKFFSSIFTKFQNCRILNLNDNLFQSDFLSDQQDYSPQFCIEELYLENIGKSRFFHELLGIIYSRNLKVWKIYSKNSVSQYGIRRVQKDLKNLINQREQFQVRCIYGNPEISEIFRMCNNDQLPDSLKFEEELKTESQFDIICMWQKALNNDYFTKVQCENKLTKKFFKNIPVMNLDVIKDFLEPMNNSYNYLTDLDLQKVGQICSESIEKTPQILCFDYQTLTLMSKYFSNVEKFFNLSVSITNNPTQLILNKNLVKYLTENTTIYKKIYFIQHKEFDIIDTRYICHLFKQFHQTELKSIIIDYDFKQSEYIHLKGTTLRNFICLFPPKSIELNDVSMDDLKIIYTILYHNNNFRHANISFLAKNNYGIAYTLREYIYQGKKNTNFFIRFLKYILYQFFDLFCSEEVVFKHDETVPILNKKLDDCIMWFVGLYLFFIVIWFPAIVLSTYKQSQSGVSRQSHQFFAAISIINLLIEVSIYHFVYRDIKHLIPNVIDDDSLRSNNQSIFGRFKYFLSKFSKQISWLKYFINLSFSLLNKFDYYSDLCFIVICYNENQHTIAYLSSFTLFFQFVLNISFIFKIRFYSGIQRDSFINTSTISVLFMQSDILELEALNGLLSIFSPISNRLPHILIKFLLEDICQVILQIFYTTAKNEINLFFILSMTSSIFSMLLGFYKLMSNKPSTISQFHFDQLSKMKIEQANKYNKQLKIYRNNMLENLQSKILNSICEQKSHDYQIQSDWNYNSRDLEIDFTEYEQTEQQCLSDLKNIESLIKLGQINLYCYRDMQKAKKYFTDALELNNFDPDVYLSLAQFYIEIYNIEEKENKMIEGYINKASQISPNYWKVYFVKYLNNYFRDQDQLALENIEKALEFDPKKIILRCNYYNIQSILSKDINKKKEYIKLFENIINETSFRYQSQYSQLGYLYLHIDDFEKSYEYFQKSISLIPKNIYSLISICHIMNKKGDYKQANYYIQKVLEIQPNFQNAIRLKKIIEEKLTEIQNK